MASRGKVLVIDDDLLVLRLTKARLESAGFEVVIRSEALGSSRAVISEAPDLVLVDLSMPALDGEALVGLLAANPRSKDVPIVFHSSENLATLQETARKTGAKGAIAKTGDDDLFIAQFERLYTRATR